MTLKEIAKIYTDLVALDDHIPLSEAVAKEEVSELRSRYHQLLMNKMRDEGIEFSDRFEAMNIALDLVRGEEDIKCE